MRDLELQNLGPEHRVSIHNVPIGSRTQVNRGMALILICGTIRTLPPIRADGHVLHSTANLRGELPRWFATRGRRWCQLDITVRLFSRSWQDTVRKISVLHISAVL
jgi:hypothetical protein